MYMYCTQCLFSFHRLPDIKMISYLLLLHCRIRWEGWKANSPRNFRAGLCYNSPWLFAERESLVKIHTCHATNWQVRNARNLESHNRNLLGDVPKLG